MLLTAFLTVFNCSTCFILIFVLFRANDNRNIKKPRPTQRDEVNFSRYHPDSCRFHPLQKMHNETLHYLKKYQPCRHSSAYNVCNPSRPTFRPANHSLFHHVLTRYYLPKNIGEKILECPIQREFQPCSSDGNFNPLQEPGKAFSQ